MFTKLLPSRSLHLSNTQEGRDGIPSFFRGGHWGSERLSDLPKITQQASGGAQSLCTTLPSELGPRSLWMSWTPSISL